MELEVSMADGNITVEVSTQAAQDELTRLRTQNETLKRDLQYARDGLTKGRTRMREDNKRLQAENAALKREAHAWSKAAETYAASEAKLANALRELVDLEDMRLRLRQLHEMGHGTDYDNYHRRLPLAWDAARAALGPNVQ